MNLKSLLKDLFQESDAPNLTEHSTLHEILESYPQAYNFIERKYGVRHEPEDGASSLKEFVNKYRLPPAPIVFMEIQLDAREVKIHEVSAPDLRNEIESGKVCLLDVREDWELKLGKIKDAEPLTATLLDEVLSKWDKATRIVLYCHHGIRSADAAVFLIDRGFANVSILKGGIDSWATEVDPNLPRYQGAYC